MAPEWRQPGDYLVTPNGPRVGLREPGKQTEGAVLGQRATEALRKARREPTA